MKVHKILSVRNLCDSAYVLRFERKEMIFIPGQHVNVGLQGDEDRPYSIYSGIYDDYLEVLIKEVSNGNISNKLKSVQPGEMVTVDQPHGSFVLDHELLDRINVWLISTGTGISPFHSFVRSYPSLDYRIIHGIKYAIESYERKDYGFKYISCTSRDTLGDFNGRVTDYVRGLTLDKKSSFFLCGNYEMIDEVYELLMQKGINKTQIKSELYF